jgi:membrane protease YdiL (CAAX protease family)
MRATLPPPIHQPGENRPLQRPPRDRTVPSRRRRIIESLAFVAVWVSAGYLLPISSNGYLLLGIPLTIAFQALVRRRPLRELLAGGTNRFALDRRGLLLAAALAVAPAIFAAKAVSSGDWVGLGWYLAATAGAFCAAFALRASSVLGALRSAAQPIAVGSLGFAAVYTGVHMATGTPVSVDTIVVTIVQFTALYFPATFLLEEVSFRGALDAHVHHEGEGRGVASAVFVSTLWGLWHLPVSNTLALPVPIQAGVLVVVHVLLGVPLSLAWRRTRNLAGPGFAHAFNDAVRNAFMAGL